MTNMKDENMFGRCAVIVSALLFAGTAHASDDDAAAAVKQALYPIAQTVSWSQPGSLRVFVSDNGQNRDGIAEAACSSLSMAEYQSSRPMVIVRVIDVNGSDTDPKQLGYAECDL